MSGAHVICVDENLLAKYGAAMRECVEAHVADYELVKPAVHSRERCQCWRESCHESLSTGNCRSCFSSIDADVGFDITSPDQQDSGTDESGDFL